MNNACNENLIRALDLAAALLELADEGDDAREDRGCGILYGTLRDCGYKIKALAQAEITAHKRKGRWQESKQTSSS